MPALLDLLIFGSVAVLNLAVEPLHRRYEKRKREAAQREPPGQQGSLDRADSNS